MEDKTLELKDRIIAIRTAEGMSQEEFANELNLSRNFINQMEKGKKNPSERTLADICFKFRISKDFLLEGKGDMYVHISHEEEIANLTYRLLKEESSSFKNRLIAALSRLDDKQWDVLEKLIDNISAQKKE